METGLLDRTHLHFFDVRRAAELITNHGWEVVDADDVVLWPSEQCLPTDAPQLRPGAPLSEALNSIRRRADPYGHTYQFVRRYQLADAGRPVARPRAPEPGGSPFLAVVLDAGALADEMLLAGIQAQRDRDVTLLVDEGATELSPPAGVTVSPIRDGDVIAALAESGARYVAVLGAGTVLGPGWVTDLRRLVEEAPGRVIVAGCADTLLTGPRLQVATLELLGVDFGGWVIPAAYALPAAALVDGGLGPLGPTLDDLLTTASRCTALCGRSDSREITMAARPETPWITLVAGVAEALDREPLIHGSGALAPTVANTLELVNLRADAAHLRDRFDVLATARDVEVAELHARVARQSTPAGALSFAAERWTTAALRHLRAWVRGWGRSR